MSASSFMRRFCLTLLCLLPLSGVQAEPASYLSGLDPDYIPQQVLPARTNLPLTALQHNAADAELRMTGLSPRLNFSFAMRADEILTAAELMLNFTPSPALLPIQSQLNVYLNGQLQQSLAISAEQCGKAVQAEVPLNALLLKDVNDLTLEFIGHYTEICEDLSSSTLWLTVDSSSTLSLSAQKIRVANDLAFFPAPFLDTKLNRFTSLPLIFSAEPSYAQLQAAAIFASWCGSQTDWRGIDFPVYLNVLPAEAHCVVFADNANRPDFLQDLPPFTQPTIIMHDLPYAQFSKLLIIGGPTAQDVITAASALALGHGLLSGPRAEVTELTEIEPRQPYDAPNFTDTSKPISFSSLVSYAGQLSTSGVRPYPIHLRLRLPPDLFIFDKDTVPLRLNYRYTKPDPAAMAQLRFKFNSALVESYPLQPEDNAASKLSELPFIGAFFSPFDAEASVPALALYHDNDLSFEFDYALTYVGGNLNECRLNAPLVHQAEIEPNSTIDLTGFYHYARMPNLSLFVKSAYPFSIMADLQDTAVLLDPHADSMLLNAFFNLMGRFGAVIGYPALKVQIMSPEVLSDEEQRAAIEDKHLLALQSLPELTEAGADPKTLPGSLTAKTRTLASAHTPKADTWLDKEQRSSAQLTGFANENSAAMLVGMQSPLNDERSVVALSCTGRAGCSLLAQKLAQPGELQEVQGSTAIIRSSGTQSFDVGESYYAGSIPFYVRLWYALSTHSLILVGLALLCTIIAASGIFYFLSRLTQRKLGGR